MNNQNAVKKAQDLLAELMQTLTSIEGESETMEISLARLDAVEMTLFKLEVKR